MSKKGAALQQALENPISDEQREGEALAVNQAAAGLRLTAKTGFKRKKLITVPSLSMKTGEERVLRFDSPITVSKVVDPKKPNEKPADIANVIDMETGEEFIFLVPSVVMHNLQDNYDGEEYVGKTFQILHQGKNSGKRYMNFSIAEVEIDE